ncbi:ribosome modulation factor [Pseudomonas sp. 5P_3.1_Bac2]|uniref:ribosome modulation factor n=1 Tax=Pseudomonas sp. 5P_3.1_Bac2 TaxID=2971617 RepID=UPI0021C9D10E|nr:ribosome modulation factor [Pseudomonas sp. 5P_3.1_Bac2]MCU1718547.1 ribosome modulation factor [Pseudomonas sp. 5P_3.1_Bac2]
MDSSNPTAQDWSLESLEKAYQKGYMAGLTGQAQHAHELSAEVLVAAWEAGWADGLEQYQLHRRHRA